MEHEERTPPPSPYSFTDACITPVPQSPSLSGELIPHPKALHKTLTLPGHGFPKILSPSSRPVPTARLPPTIPANPGLLICTAVLALMGFLLSGSWTVCSCLEHSSIRTSASGELHQETPVPALRSNPLQSQNVGRKLMVQPWPFSRICERDRLLLCLKGGFISP